MIMIEYKIFWSNSNSPHAHSSPTAQCLKKPNIALSVRGPRNSSRSHDHQLKLVQNERYESRATPSPKYRRTTRCNNITTQKRETLCKRTSPDGTPPLADRSSRAARQKRLYRVIRSVCIRPPNHCCDNFYREELYLTLAAKIIANSICASFCELLPMLFVADGALGSTPSGDRSTLSLLLPPRCRVDPPSVGFTPRRAFTLSEFSARIFCASSASFRAAATWSSGVAPLRSRDRVDRWSFRRKRAALQPGLEFGFKFNADPDFDSDSAPE